MKTKILAAALLAAPMAFSSFPGAALADGAPLVATQSLTEDAALKVAQAAIASCRAAGFQVAVAVVDRGGHPQVLLRDRFAGPHTPDTAIGKAWTANSFRTTTTELSAHIAGGTIPEGLRNLPGVVALGGGLPILAAGSIVGAVGVSGSPSGEQDDKCAQAGIDAIAVDLNL